jgi:hypothetical protein
MAEKDLPAVKLRLPVLGPSTRSIPFLIINSQALDLWQISQMLKANFRYIL